MVIADAIAAVDPRCRLLAEIPYLADVASSAAAWHVVAAGKAARPMLSACLDGVTRPPASAMAVAPGGSSALATGVRVFAGGHPVPTLDSVAAGRCARRIAEAAAPDDLLVVLLSGGASALLALPADGVTPADKQAATVTLLRAGADITALNTVRKHLSAIKGGQLAAAGPARVIGLALSDVVGDDLSVIGSGPTVPDPSTFGEALDVLDRFGGRPAYPASVVDVLLAGRMGARPETPKPGSPVFGRTTTRVIGSRRDAMTGAAARARALGYDTVVLESPVVGEARVAAPAYAAVLRRLAETRRHPFCVVSSGETTVTVTGHGSGGRNQEFALALAPGLSALEVVSVVASVGTDGIDGPTVAAGGLITSRTWADAAAMGIDVPTYLRDNDSYTCLSRLDALVITGPTGTNVGDVQVAIVSPGMPEST